MGDQLIAIDVGQVLVRNRLKRLQLGRLFGGFGGVMGVERIAQSGVEARKHLGELFLGADGIVDINLDLIAFVVEFSRFFFLLIGLDVGGKLLELGFDKLLGLVPLQLDL